MSHRTGIYAAYAGLFDDDSSAGDQPDDDGRLINDESPAEKKKRLREEAIENKKRMKWNWFGAMYKLAKGDPTKFDFITKMNFILCLNTLAYIKENKIDY